MNKFKFSVLPVVVFGALAMTGCSSSNHKDAHYELHDSEIIVEDEAKRKSIADLHKLSVEGVGKAQGKLAQEYYDGIYLKRDDERALYWAKEAKSNGDGLGTLILARMTFYGESTEKNVPLALALMETIVKERIEAGYILGKMYLEAADQSPDYALKGAEMISKTAERGFPVAQYEHAQTMLMGVKDSDPKVTDAVRKSIRKNAVEYMSMAADQQFVPAMRDMGLFYLNGFGVARNEDKGKGLLEAAAHHGDRIATECLTTGKCDLGVYQ
ncbi:SEL1-like repeat protein [Acinetobacter sp. SwsAc5]|uniref:tetratricopeptide repeat protein n=1 Tax=Acinetobacter sp. SwsAc5 TaxID=2749438 RepID=UPI0015BE5B42|nr:tetratricopeptide repeat protein [Acinetobacter sp. SwsAc5]NWK51996.1 SEL1-like repeat protein [Acinetobacter sp. SwsAc5]